MRRANHLERRRLENAVYLSYFFTVDTYHTIQPHSIEGTEHCNTQ